MQGVAFHCKTSFHRQIARRAKCALDARGANIQTVLIAMPRVLCSDRQEHHVSL